MLIKYKNMGGGGGGGGRRKANKYGVVTLLDYCLSGVIRHLSFFSPSQLYPSSTYPSTHHHHCTKVPTTHHTTVATSTETVYLHLPRIFTTPTITTSKSRVKGAIAPPPISNILERGEVNNSHLHMVWI